jgi:hypothetical protein
LGFGLARRFVPGQCRAAALPAQGGKFWPDRTIHNALWILLHTGRVSALYITRDAQGEQGPGCAGSPTGFSAMRQFNRWLLPDSAGRFSVDRSSDRSLADRQPG